MNIKKFIEEFSSIIDIGMSSDINAFLRGDKDILKYQIETDSKKTCIIKIKLNNYNDALEKKFWESFVSFIGYRYLNLYIREELQSEKKYSYITADKDMVGIRIEMFIS